MTWEVGKTYPMRGGGEFHVLEIFGPLAAIFGRARSSGIVRWDAATRNSDGRLSGISEQGGDLVPPPPPVVVSDAVLKTYTNAMVATPGILDLGRLAGLSAAITTWLTEHPHMLRAWQEGPK